MKEELTLDEIVMHFGGLLAQTLPSSLEFLLIVRDRADGSSGYTSNLGGAAAVLALLRDYVGKLGNGNDGGLTFMEVHRGKIRVAGSKPE